MKNEEIEERVLIGGQVQACCKEVRNEILGLTKSLIHYPEQLRTMSPCSEGLAYAQTLV